MKAFLFTFSFCIAASFCFSQNQIYLSSVIEHQIFGSGYYGCTDSEACNYDPDADYDDDSCEYAEEFYDCDGNCLSDEDGDGICDELEIEGCTDEEACNYDSEATDEDGSCEYVVAFAITGEQNPQPFTTETYDYNETLGSTYIWEATGGNISTGQGSSSVEILWDDLGSGSLSVFETNSSGCIGPLVMIDVQIVTSVNELNAAFIHIYPNPVSDLLIVETGLKDNMQMELYNVAGQLVYSKQLAQATSSIDIASFASGNYHLVLKSEKRNLNKAVIFMRE